MAAEPRDEPRQYRSATNRALLFPTLMTKFAFIMLGVLVIAAAAVLVNQQLNDRAAGAKSITDGQQSEVADQQSMQADIASLTESLATTRQQLDTIEQSVTQSDAPTIAQITQELRSLSDRVDSLEYKTTTAARPDVSIVSQDGQADPLGVDARGELIINNKSNRSATVYVNDMGYQVDPGAPASIAAPKDFRLRLAGGREVYHRGPADWTEIDGRSTLEFEIAD